MTNDIGIVAIGRNEGQRLQQCLESLVSTGYPMVYVDSGSTDGSVEFARPHCAAVIELDMSIPFTAARARNEGFARLLQIHPNLRYVQFIDGDCAMDLKWLPEALVAINGDTTLAAVCGRRRERYPEKSVYNQLCDLEWDAPVGLTDDCGGDALVCVAAYRQVDGFNPNLIAGEDTEFYVRLRIAGWKMRRLDAEMSLHDAAIYKFSAWWRRSKRCGYAYAEGVYMHGAGPVRHRIRQLRSLMVWGALLPLISLALAWPTRGWALVFLLLYPLLWIKIAIYEHKRGRTIRQCILQATFLVMTKFPEVSGAITFWRRHLRGRQVALIEYK